jgi:ubiquinone/menaquinone biosynthesis C-methylase UbiE
VRYFSFLPIEDRTFDLVSAMSVFTEVDEAETSWLLELHRIMKPSGSAIVTVHMKTHG